MGNKITNTKAKSSPPNARGAGFPTMCVLLLAVITLLLGRCYLPGHTMFSNDGPLGRLMSQCHRLPDAFTGVWEDLNALGYRVEGAIPNITYGLRYILGPVLFSKFYVSAALLILGLAAWYFFRQSGLAPPACILGGLAAALNSDFFSTACWGIAAHPLAVAMCFLALAVLLKTSGRQAWIRVALAGLAVGMGLAEGADVGAILSLYVAAFVMYQAWFTEGPRVKNLAVGAGRLALVAGFAAFLAAQAISALVTTQVEGVNGMAQDTKTRAERWNWATQWSLPKVESLSLVVPGLFGYRLDTTGGGEYWGELGRDAAWDKYLAGGGQGDRPRTLLRQTGGGIYAGVTVVLVAIWAGLQSFRRNDSIFNLSQRRWLWFWMGVIAVSLPLAYGHHAPFYRLIYGLPYFSTIRNPVKFITLVSFALVVLFAYGVDGLWRRCVQTAKPGFTRQSPAVVRFDNWWICGCLVTLGLSLVAWLIYANSQAALLTYLQDATYSVALAHAIAEFSVNQVGWFLLFFILSAALVGWMLKGGFAGARANWGAGFLGLVLLLDLGRANLPWIIDWNYVDKYSSNPVIDLLRDKPFEGRVALEPYKRKGVSGVIDDLYHFEWAQQQFQYYDIQAFDIVQMPRVPADLLAYWKAAHYDSTAASIPFLARIWQLTNTRLLVGMAVYLDDFNERLDPVHHRIRILQRFNLVPKPGSTTTALTKWTAELSPTGDCAVFQFDGALPRAKLYGTWQVNTNGPDALQELFGESFDPARSVMVSGGLPAAAATGGTNENTGTVEFLSYAPKDIKLSAKAINASVLLYNDRLDPNWKVLVDGKSAPLLRCNYLMRGVYLESGAHEVEFLFKPPVGALYVSLAAIGVGLVLIGILAVGNPRTKVTPAVPVPSQVPLEQASPPQPKAQPPPRNKRPKHKAKR